MEARFQLTTITSCGHTPGLTTKCQARSMTSLCVNKPLAMPLSSPMRRYTPVVQSSRHAIRGSDGRGCSPACHLLRATDISVLPGRMKHGKLSHYNDSVDTTTLTYNDACFWNHLQTHVTKREQVCSRRWDESNDVLAPSTFISCSWYSVRNIIKPQDVQVLPPYTDLVGSGILT